MTQSVPATDAALGPLTRGMNVLGVLCILALVCFVCADIAGRNLFDHPLAGVPELAALALVAAVFLQLPLVLQEGRLTRTVVLLEKLGGAEQIRSAWEALLALTAAAILLLLAVGAWPDLQRAFLTREFAGVEGVFTITVWPVKALIVLGALIAALACLFSLRHQCKVRRSAQAWRWPLLVTLCLVAVVVLAAVLNPAPQTTGWLLILVLLALIALGMPIALALLVCGFAGLAILKQDTGIAVRTLSLAAEGSISEYVFATVPLFVLMGMLVNASDIGKDAFASAQRLFGRLPGGLGVATVAANAIFAAITGISIASAAIFSKIALPELVQQGYSKRFAVGLIAGSSVLGMLIPPSLLLIIYGVIAEVSIGALFIAAIVPGLLLAVLLGVTVIVLAVFAPAFVGTLQREGGPAVPDGSWAISGLVPLLLLVLVVMGGIYGGFFTPTEAGAAGSFAALLVALWRRRISWRGFYAVMQETGQVSASILFLIICATTFSMMLTLSELPQAIAALLGDSGLGMAGFLALYLLLLLVLGTVLDSTSILLIMLPLALPVVTALGGNLVWFGIVTVIGIEIGLLTPPLGLSVYVIKASIDDPSITLGMIFSGALPFVLVTLLATILLMAVPSLSLMLL